MELTSLVSGAGFALLIPVVAYNRIFISLWVGNRQYTDDAVNLLACAIAWIWSLTSLWGWPLSGSGYIASWTPYAIAFSAINIAISIAATKLIGISGPLIGTLAGFLLVHAWAQPRLLGRIFDRRLRFIWTPALLHLVWSIPLGTVVWMLARTHPPAGWFWLGVESTAATLIGFALFWLAVGSVLRAELLLRLRAVWS